MSLTLRRMFALAVTPLLLAALGCDIHDPDDKAIARASTDPVVFDDDYSPDVYFQPFFRTHYTAATIDSTYAFNGFAPDGSRSLKVEVPGAGSALGPYAGGVLTSSGTRDLADYNALTFYVRTDVETARLNEVGFGNDNTGTSLYGVSRAAVELDREWTKRIVPIPNAAKLVSERGLFLFSEGYEDAHPEGYNIWFDEIRFEHVEGVDAIISQFTSVVPRRYFVGTTASVGSADTVFDTPEGRLRFGHSTSYFDLLSSDPSVGVATRSGQIRVVGVGQTVVTATLGALDVRGSVTINGHVPPTVAAAAPTLPADQVISMFSTAYDDVPIGTWRTDWSQGSYQEYAVAGRTTKMYYDLSFVGIDFQDDLIDASEMGFLHLDVYAPGGTTFRVELQSFDESLTGYGIPGQLPKVEFNSTTSPEFNTGEWSSLDIPLDAFGVDPANWDWSRIGQLILGGSSDLQLVLVDNIYWHE